RPADSAPSRPSALRSPTSPTQATTSSKPPKLPQSPALPQEAQPAEPQRSNAAVGEPGRTTATVQRRGWRARPNDSNGPTPRLASRAERQQRSNAVVGTTETVRRCRPKAARTAATVQRCGSGHRLRFGTPAAGRDTGGGPGHQLRAGTPAAVRDTGGGPGSPVRKPVLAGCAADLEGEAAELDGAGVHHRHL